MTAQATMIVAATFVGGGIVAVAAGVEDHRSHRLSNRHTLALAVTALVGFGLAALLGSERFPVADLLLGAAYFSGPWLAIHLVSPAAIGFGDVKLTAALGLYLGWLDPTLAFAALLAACVVFVLIVVATRSGWSSNQPFGPALIAGAAVASVAGFVAV